MVRLFTTLKGVPVHVKAWTEYTFKFIQQSEGSIIHVGQLGCWLGGNSTTHPEVQSNGLSVYKVTRMTPKEN